MRQRAFLAKAAGGGPALATKRKTMDKLDIMRSGAWLRAIDPDIGASLPPSRGALLPPQRPASQRGERERIVRELLGGIGASFVLHSPFRCDFGTQITIGDHFTGNFNLTILDEAPVHIGDHVFIGPNVGIYTVTHALHPDQRNEGVMRSRPVRIEDDVWIGAQAVILPGVTVGRGAVVGAGSVVTRDIPAGMLAAGNPCRVLRPHCRGRPHRPGRDTELSTAYRTPYRSKRGKRLRRTRNEVTNRPKSAGPETAAAANKTGERCARPARLRRQSRRDDRNESGRTPP